MSKNIENSIFRSNQVGGHTVTRISQVAWVIIENVYFHCIFIVSFRIFVRFRKKTVFFKFEIAHVLEKKMSKNNENSIFRSNQVAGHIVTQTSQGAWFLIENVYFHCIIIVFF